MKKHILATAVALAVAATGANAETNIALGKTVTVGGGAFGGSSSTWGDGSLEWPSTVTDGNFVANGQQWNLGTVFWYVSATNNPYIEIDLGASYDVTKITLQADNNDLYRVTYRDTGGNWLFIADIDPVTAGWGMAQNTITFPSVRATGFRIADGPDGDCCDSVSEFQAFGVAVVPEPETYAMMLAGLGLVGAIARRRCA